MSKLEKVYPEKKLMPEDAKAIFTDLLGNHWGAAMFSQMNGNREFVDQAKNSFYEGLDEMLQL
jgi:hypothetical protein